MICSAEGCHFKATKYDVCTRHLDLATYYNTPEFREDMTKFYTLYLEYVELYRDSVSKGQNFTKVHLEIDVIGVRVKKVPIPIKNCAKHLRPLVDKINETEAFYFHLGKKYGYKLIHNNLLVFHEQRPISGFYTKDEDEEEEEGENIKHY